jgi:hypothetical protein
MKKSIFLTILMFTFFKIEAQISIGKTTIDGSGLLDFATNDNKGIVLPYTLTITNPVNGTLTYDVPTKKIKCFIDNSWVDMTDSGVDPPVINTDPDVGSGVIIGSSTSSASGVLILESKTRSLILPKVNNPSTDIYNPAVGTICYDLSTNSVAFFNGSVWAYWK